MRWYLGSALAALVMAAAWHGPSRAAPACVSGLTTPQIVVFGSGGYSCDLGLARYTFFDTMVEWTTTTIHFAEPRSTAMGLYTPPGQTTAILAPNEVHRVTFQGFTKPDGSSFLGPGQDYGMFTFEVSANQVRYIVASDSQAFITDSGEPSPKGYVTYSNTVVFGGYSGGPVGSFLFGYEPDMDASGNILQIVTSMYADINIVPVGWVFSYDIPTSVPEPGSLALLLAGLTGLLVCRARRPG
jgi:hypothetical protein